MTEIKRAQRLLIGHGALVLLFGFIIMAWTIVVASTINPLFPEACGLVFNVDSNLANGIAFFFSILALRQPLL